MKIFTTLQFYTIVVTLSQYLFVRQGCIVDVTNPKANGREIQRHYSEQLGAGPSFRTITY